MQPYLIYLLVALALVAHCVATCFLCGQRRKIRSPTVADKQRLMQPVELKNTGYTVVTEFNEEERE
ncbi:hypothetical protein AAVH_29066 [Aphelenchoides avenae]|nr:hypothetical protein AAVH_29066 [Aphelenchus avenae]